MLLGLGNLVTNYWLTWFLPTCVAAVGFLTLCWKGIKAFVKIHEAAEKIARIEHEFQPNSGTSMRDQIDAVRAEQATVKTALTIQVRQMTDHIAADSQAFKRQDRFNTKIEGTLERIEDHLRSK
jgi:hypothetical protein